MSERADPLLGASPPSLLSRFRVRLVDRLFFLAHRAPAQRDKKRRQRLQLAEHQAP